MSKRIFSLFFSSFIALLLVVPVVNAAPPDTHLKLLKKNTEIKDQTELINRAKNNISDLPLEEQVSTKEITSSSKKKLLYVTQYKTAQLLTEEQDTTNDNIISTYALTTLASYSASKYNSGWDKTSSVKAESTIYVTYVYDSHGVKYWKSAGVSGGWGVYASGISVTNKKVIYGVYGVPEGGGLTQVSETKYPTGSTFEYTSPTSWKAVLPTATGQLAPKVGVTTSATLSGFGDTWSLELVNFFA
ncbi:hypothetical protein [Paenibacillus sp. YPG26]|uniref:hypothetical protein n=1 Tax=Paenibacillus sp. YPG26 TaxID=2878915 RepID=UPI002041FC34|nr:hypothetical protein [Paenibacillus sp. YPG26]USB33573.1 hypothetical protein LDO05_01735 [Paenibacillus sp. YPG26]